MCMVCGSPDHILDRAPIDGIISPPLSPPTFTLSQIVRHLQTQWGGGEEGKVHKWMQSSLTYSMPDFAPTNLTGTPAEASGLVVMPSAMKDTARLAFELWDDLIATSLNESVGNPDAQITFNYSSSTSGGGTYARPEYYLTAPDRQFTGQQVWMNSTWSTHDQASDLNFGGYGFQTYLHEIGHTLGLSHPGTYNAGGGEITYAGNAEYAQDNRQYTIMSYFGGYDKASGTWLQDGTYTTSVYSSTPMLHDVAAIQALYGADMTTRTGNTVYGFNSTADRSVFDFSRNANPIFTIWDAGGSDTIDTSRFAATQTIDLNAGTYSDIGGFNDNIAIAFGATIENAAGGSGTDTMHGNAVANLLNGNAGADVLNGDGGDDTLIGGAGVDRLLGGDGNDTIHYDASDTLSQVLGGNGTDTLYVANAPAPNSFNLASHGFEAATVVTTDTTGQSWSSRTDQYNASWQALLSTLVNDDGTSVRTELDVAATQAWQRTDTSSTSTGLTRQQSVLFDNSSAQLNEFDPTNAQSWSRATTYYDTASQTVRQTVANDDGTSRMTDFDAANAQAWTRADAFYDTRGQTVLQSVAMDDGTSLAHYWDASNLGSWSKATNYYDAFGNRVATTVLNDDGSTYAF